MVNIMNEMAIITHFRRVPRPALTHMLSPWLWLMPSFGHQPLLDHITTIRIIQFKHGCDVFDFAAKCFVVATLVAVLRRGVLYSRKTNDGLLSQKIDRFGRPLIHDVKAGLASWACGTEKVNQLGKECRTEPRNVVLTRKKCISLAVAEAASS